MKTTPSQAPRWVPCPGSAHMESLHPRPATHPVTEEGKAIHWACEGVMIRWNPRSELAPIPLSDYIGKACPENGVVITDEMVAAGMVYLSAVWCRVQLHPGGLTVEKALSLHHVGLQMRGRADAVWYSEDRKWLTVFDAKFGYKAVSAFENWQLLIYAIGALERTVEGIEIVVVQPRGQSIRQPVKQWVLTPEQLVGYQTIITERKRLADLGPEAPTVSGKHCRHCMAAATCPTLEADAWHAYHYAGQATPQDLDPDDIAYQLDAFETAQELLRSRRDALETLATSKIHQGELVPGWQLHASMGDRQWRSEQEAAGLGLLFNVEMFERKTISPAVAEARGVNNMVVNALTVRRERPAKLRREKA